jgi:Uma2 family endonuclease
MTSPAKKNQKFTYGDYLEWPDEERWEIIDGEAYNMTPAPSRAHQKLLGSLFTTFHNYLEGKSCIEKLSLYERQRVPEYWIVHPIDKTVMVFRLIDSREYGKPRIYAAAHQIPVGLFPDLVIDLKKVFKD